MCAHRNKKVLLHHEARLFVLGAYPKGISDKYFKMIMKVFYIESNKKTLM
jgi:hypothetical protein